MEVIVLARSNDGKLFFVRISAMVGPLSNPVLAFCYCTIISNFFLLLSHPSKTSICSRDECCMIVLTVTVTVTVTSY